MKESNTGEEKRHRKNYYSGNSYQRRKERRNCYKEGAKTKTYSVTIKSDVHKVQMEFQETEDFKEKSRERYKIEAKNSELKHRHGL